MENDKDGLEFSDDENLPIEEESDQDLWLEDEEEDENHEDDEPLGQWFSFFRSKKNKASERTSKAYRKAKEAQKNIKEAQRLLEEGEESNAIFAAMNARHLASEALKELEMAQQAVGRTSPSLELQNKLDKIEKAARGVSNASKKLQNEMESEAMDIEQKVAGAKRLKKSLHDRVASPAKMKFKRAHVEEKSKKQDEKNAKLQGKGQTKDISTDNLKKAKNEQEHSKKGSLENQIAAHEKKINEEIKNQGKEVGKEALKQQEKDKETKENQAQQKKQEIKNEITAYEKASKSAINAQDKQKMEVVLRRVKTAEVMAGYASSAARGGRWQEAANCGYRAKMILGSARQMAVSISFAPVSMPRVSKSIQAVLRKVERFSKADFDREGSNFTNSHNAIRDKFKNIHGKNETNQQMHPKIDPNQKKNNRGFRLGGDDW